MAAGAERIFKTGWFAKACKKARITDDELCAAMRAVMLGQADDLGGGVYKKRLGKNLFRSLILAQGWPVLGLYLSFRKEGPGQHR